MRTRSFLLILLSLCVIAAVACRPKAPAQPQVIPAVEPPPPPVPPATQAVPSPDEDFPEQQEPDVLSGDIADVNRRAHENGWIQDAFFAFDESTLDADAQAALRQSATWLREHPEFRIRIEGHCDERGTEQYNLALGDRRAETAAAYLATLGVDRARMENVSLGEERPFEEGSTEAAWAQNRRAHLVISGRR